MRITLQKIIWITSINIGWAQEVSEIHLQGLYNGRNLFVQNPLYKQSKHLCVEEIYLNDQIVMQMPSSSAIEVRMEDLLTRAEVDIRIIHKSSCRPEVLNPEVLSVVPLVRFEYLYLRDNKLCWKIQGEEDAAHYQIEYVSGGAWEKEATVAAGADSAVYVYAPINFLPGVNKYRVQYISPNCRLHSSDVEILLDDKLITFNPAVVRDQMTLSERTYFEILDAHQQLIIKGEARQIPLRRLKPGDYFIVLDGKLYPFVKR